MMRKWRQLGIEVQSSSSKEIKQEARSLDEGGLVTNSLQRLQIDDLAKDLPKRKLVKKSVSGEMQKTRTSVESDDDLMDLAGFLAQKQMERNSSFPSSSLPKSKHFRCFEKYPTQHKPNHVLRHKMRQLSDQVQLQPNLSFTEGLVTRQDALRNSPDQVASEKGHPCLVVEQGQQQLVQVYDSLVVVPEEQNVSRQGQKESIIITKRDGTVSVSKDNSNHMGKACEKKLDQEGKSDASVMMAKKMCKGYSTPQRKNSVACDLKKSNASPKYSNGSIPSQAISEHNHLHLSTETCQQVNQLLDSYMQEKSIMSKHTKGMRTGHRSKRTSFVTRKAGNNTKYCASKRLKSATQKSLKKLKLNSNHDLTEEQNTSTYIMASEAPNDGHIHLESEEACQQRNQVETSLIPERFVESEQATEVRNNSTGNEAFSDLNDIFDDRRCVTVKDSGHKRKNVNFLEMMGTKKKGSSASQCKPIAASRSSYGISSGSEYLSGTIPTIDKENIVFRSEPASSTAIKQGKGSSISKTKKSGTKKSIDAKKLSPNQHVRTQVVLNCSHAGVGSEDAQIDPIPGEGQETNPDEVCLMQENSVMAIGDDGTGTCSKIGDGDILHSRDCLDFPIKTGENKSGHKRKAACRVSMSKQKDEGSSRSPRKKSTGKKSMKERKALAKSEGRQMSEIEQTNAALNAVFSNGNARKPQFAVADIRGNGHCSERNLNSGTCKFMPPETAEAVNSKGFTPQQTLIQHTVAPTSKDRELLIINDDSVQLTLSSEVILADLSKMSCKTFQAENLNKKDDNLNKRTLGLKSVSPKVIYTAIRESEIEPWHSSVDSPVQSIGQKSLIRNADARLVVKNQDALEHDNSLVQCHGNAFSNGFEKQSLSSATCLPAKGFLGSNISQHVPNSSGPFNSLGCLLPHATLATPSTESAPEFNQCSPSNYPTVFGFAQGNQVNIPTKSSQETSWRSNYDLNLYIQERSEGINAHRANCDSGYEGCKQNASVTMDTAARKRSEPDKTIAKNMLGSSSARKLTGFEALDSDPLKQSLVETMTNHGKVETNQRIQYINVLTNTRQVPQANQNLRPTSIPLTKTGSVAKIKDFTSKRTMQSEYVEPEIVVGGKNLTLGLAPNILKHQNFRRKPAIVTSNVTDLTETETWEADTSKQRITSMHDSAKRVLTSQSHISLMPTPLKPLKLAPGHKNYLNMPAQKTKQHISSHSTFPSMPYTDQYGRLIRTSDKPFQMEARTHCIFSNASETAFVSSTQENVRREVSKGLYGRADINFLRPVIRGDEVSGGASDKEGSVLTSACKDSSLELTLSIQQGSERVKQLK